MLVYFFQIFARPQFKWRCDGEHYPGFGFLTSLLQLKFRSISILLINYQIIQRKMIYCTCNDVGVNDNLYNAI